MPEHRREDEGEDERLDRELLELLNEVRVAMPGVQVLFAFLLAVPFQQRFTETTPFQQTVFLVTLLCAAGATAFLVAPVAYHRIMFRAGDKPALVKTGNVSLLIGLALLATAMTCAVLLVTDVLYEEMTTTIVAVAAGAMFALLWFGVAGMRRLVGGHAR
ncbi:MAG: hypothetical protein JWO90_973 [Solirubrobacterales bacterium]|jgi:hypothetical protein|nr:hypothetical protein [Solirubrobacterales bacterium]